MSTATVTRGDLLAYLGDLLATDEITDVEHRDALDNLAANGVASIIRDRVRFTFTAETVRCADLIRCDLGIYCPSLIRTRITRNNPEGLL